MAPHGRLAGQSSGAGNRSGVLPPGTCTTLSCELPIPGSPVNVNIHADDDGSGHGTTTECDEANNLGIIRDVGCGVVVP